MYVPEAFAESDPEALRDLVRRHPLGTWIVSGAHGLEAQHVPFLLDETRGDPGTLTGHVARANPVWRSLPAAGESLVVFHGPEAYVSPSWYPGKRTHGRVVPTWNYAVVHVHGEARAIDDPAWLRRHVERLVEVHEADRRQPWSVSDAPADFVEGLLRAIVGIEIPIARWIGKWKASQNRPQPDRRGVAEGLRACGDDRSRAVADLVERCAGAVAGAPVGER